MNFSKNDKISNNQLRAVIIAALLGNLAISAPLKIISISGSAAYLSVLLGGVAAAVLFYLAIKLMGASFTKSYEDTAQEVLGRWFSVILFLVVFIHIVLFSGFQLSAACTMVQNSMERGVNSVAAALILSAAAVYMAFKGSECSSRMSEIASVIMVVFILFIFALSLPSFDVETVKFTPHEGVNIINGSMFAAGSLCASEYVFILSAKANDTKKSARAVFWAFIAITLILSLGTMLSVNAFGVKEAQRKIWPVIEMMNYTEFPGSLVERQEVLMSGFYIISSYILTGVSVYIASTLLKKIFKSSKNAVFVILSAAAVFAVSLFGNGIYEKFNFIYWLYKYNVIIFFVMMIVPLAAYIRRNKKCGN